LDNGPDLVPEDPDCETDWMCRQQKLGIATNGARLKPTEVQFAERMVAAGQCFEWLGPASSDEFGPLPTNDFVWHSRGGEEWEQKTVQRMRYKTIRHEIIPIVSAAKERGVTKENFVISIRGAPPQVLVNQLSAINVRNPGFKIKRLVLEFRGRFLEIRLQ
jgi:hypothetical protein